MEKNKPITIYRKSEEVRNNSSPSVIYLTLDNINTESTWDIISVHDFKCISARESQND